MEGGAYGAGKATGQFDPLSYIKKPQVIVRAVSLFFSIIVFGCIASQGWWEDKCQYNDDPNACGFGTTIGVLAFIGCLALLVLDALFDNISSIQQRKYIVIGDIVFSGLWTFFWFVTFCYLADAWRKSEVNAVDGFGKSGVEAAIAFSFFSIGTFAGSTVLAVLKYRQGVSEQFQPSGGYEPDQMGGTTQPTPSPYSSYPSGETGDPYQQPPFSGGQPGGMQSGGAQMGAGMQGGMQGGMGGGMGGGGGGMGTQQGGQDFHQPTY